MVKADGMVDTNILKEVLDWVNEFEIENMNLKNKIEHVDQHYKSLTEQLMLNKYDNRNGQTLEGNV